MIPYYRLKSETAQPTPLEAAWIKRHFTDDPLRAHRKGVAWAWAQGGSTVIVAIYGICALNLQGDHAWSLGYLVGCLASGGVSAWLGLFSDRRRSFYKVLASGTVTPFIKRALDPTRVPPPIPQ